MAAPVAAIPTAAAMTHRNSRPQNRTYHPVSPPLLVAKTARLLGVSTAKSFIALTAISALASALAVFWLLTLILEDDRLAAIGVLVVLLATSSNLVVEYLLGFGDSNNYLPFLRRYLPAVPFPILFCYCATIWRMFHYQHKRVAFTWALSAGLLFAALVFSYAYHWTFAAVWTFCFAAIWLLCKRQNRKHSLARLAPLAGLMVIAIGGYLLLAAKLGPTTGEVHFLASSHAPDLFRLTELMGFRGHHCSRLAYMPGAA